MKKTIQVKSGTCNVYNSHELENNTATRYALRNEGENYYVSSVAELLKSKREYKGRPWDTRPAGKVIMTGTRGEIQDKLDSIRAEKERTLTLPTKGKRGRVVRSGRLFGVELELVRGYSTLTKVLPRCKDIVLKGDASVNGEGIEVNTPPLSGTTAEYIFNNVLKQATSDASSDRSCGLHIHIDARDFQRQARELGRQYAEARLFQAYIALQPFFFSLVPQSRRANTYCSAYGEQTLAKVLGADTKTSAGAQIVCDTLYSISRETRYKWYNTRPYWHEGHYEVRLHSGTRDTHKILEWANLHTAIADGAMRGVFTQKELQTLNTQGTLLVLETLQKKLKLTDSSVKYWRARYSQFNNN